MDDAELERVIARLVTLKNEAPDASATHALYVRQLDGMRRKYEFAGPWIESLDPYWGG